MKTAWNIIKGLFLGLLFSGVVFMIFVGLIWLLCLPMTKEGKEQQKRHESFCELVNHEAISYIEEKYGFTPEITGTIQEHQRQIFGYQYFDRGIAYMTYDNRDFHVCYDDEADICYDDYQYEEIYAALEEIFRANGAGYEKMIVDAWGDVRVSIDNEFEEASQNLFHTYYDGRNLAEMLTERGFTAAEKYVLKDPLCIGCRLRPDIMPPSKELFDISSLESVPACSVTEYIVVTIDLTAGEPKVIVPLSDGNLQSEERDT